MHQSFIHRLISSNVRHPVQNWINQPLTSFLSHDQVPQEEKFNFPRNAENILEDKDIPERVGRRYGSLGYSEVAETSVDGKIRKLNSVSYKINLSEYKRTSVPRKWYFYQRNCLDVLNLIFTKLNFHIQNQTKVRCSTRLSSRLSSNILI